ncbi:MAG: hypothetical protein OXC40_00775 [Proteobacteria bacterium]|nr:hypothetical protein [Pseudomonadota bacterium]
MKKNVILSVLASVACLLPFLLVAGCHMASSLTSSFAYGQVSSSSDLCLTEQDLDDLTDLYSATLDFDSASSTVTVTTVKGATKRFAYSVNDSGSFCFENSRVLVFMAD